MRQIWLTMNGQPVDLPASTKGLIKFSQARSALADISARVGEFSFPLTLPPTQRNARVFGIDRLHPLGLDKFGPYTDFAYELRCEGQVFAGTFRLSSLKNGYTGTLIGDGLSWALLLADKKLTDLAFEPIVYNGSQLESILQKDCDATDVQFPLVAYGNFFAPPLTQTLADGTTKEVPLPAAAVLDYPLSVDDYPPSVYYVNILRQIFAGIGWQLQGRELDSEAWRATVMLPAGADMEKAWPWGALLSARARGAGQAFSYYAAGPGDGFASNAVGFGTMPPDEPSLHGESFFLPVPVTTTVNSPTRAMDARTATYTAPRSGVYDFTWSATISDARRVFGGDNIDHGDPFVSALLRPLAMGLVLRRGGQTFTDGDGGLLVFDPAVGQQPAFAANQTRVLSPTRLDVPSGRREAVRLGYYQGNADGVYLEAGDCLTLAVFGRRTVADGYDNILAHHSECTITFSAASFACTKYTDNDGLSKTLLQPADCLPPLVQRDVVRDFLQRTDSFIVADAGRRVATVLSRSELSQAGGEPINLSDRCAQSNVEYLPSAGAGVGSIVFAPADSSDDPLTPTGADVVLAPIGTGDGQQAVSSLFAPVAFRTTYLRNTGIALPTCSTKDVLAQNRSETEWDVSSQAPRLLRYTGPNSGTSVPFLDRAIPLAGAAWDGPLTWDGETGAVATYYADTLRRAVFGHIGRVSLPISPALYQQLQPGRRVLLHGASYTLEALQSFDPADEAGLSQLDLSREVL
jgi:hypothetical protein